MSTDSQPDLEDRRPPHLTSAPVGGTAPVAGEHPDLADLVRGVARQDHAAFEALYDSTGALVYGISLRVLRSERLAEEVAQETFIQVWQHAQQFDPARGAAKSWIAMLAHRRAVDLVRREQSASIREDRVGRSAGPDFDVVAETAAAHDEHQRVNTCLGSLTTLQREAVGLAYYGGMTYLQVSERLGVNNATVKTRIRDGLVRLRDCLEPRVEESLR